MDLHQRSIISSIATVVKALGFLDTNLLLALKNPASTKINSSMTGALLTTAGLHHGNLHDAMGMGVDVSGVCRIQNGT